MEAAAVAYLATVAAVTSLVADRIRPTAAAQGDPLPRLQYQRISTAPTRTQDGDQGVERVRLQWTCVAATYAAAKALARAVEDAAAGFRGTHAGCQIKGAFHEGQRDVPGPVVGGSSRPVDAVAVDWLVSWSKG